MTGSTKPSDKPSLPVMYFPLFKCSRELVGQGPTQRLSQSPIQQLSIDAAPSYPSDWETPGLLPNPRMAARGLARQVSPKFSNANEETP
jgi:hypothetical protein